MGFVPTLDSMAAKISAGLNISTPENNMSNNNGTTSESKNSEEPCAWRVGVSMTASAPAGNNQSQNSVAAAAAASPVTPRDTPGKLGRSVNGGVHCSGTFNPTLGGGGSNNTAAGAHNRSSNSSRPHRGVRLGMEIKEGSFYSPSTSPALENIESCPEEGPSLATTPAAPATDPYQSSYESQLNDEAQIRAQPTLAAACDVLGFDVAEIWLRTSTKTHALVASYLRPTALDETQREELAGLYYGVDASNRTHKLSPSLCKQVKNVNDVFWVPDDVSDAATAGRALSLALYKVQTAVAIPVTHPASNTNLTIIFINTQKVQKTSFAIEFLVHMSLATALAAVQPLNSNMDRHQRIPNTMHRPFGLGRYDPSTSSLSGAQGHLLSQSDHPTALIPLAADPIRPATADGFEQQSQSHRNLYSSSSNSPPRLHSNHNSITRPSSISPLIPGLDLNLSPTQLQNREYLTDGTNNWIHTGIYKNQPVIIKELKPECEDRVGCIDEIEQELDINSKIQHPNICKFFGAGLTPRGTNFLIFERLDGGTLTQAFGYEGRIRDKRRRFGLKKKKMPIMDALKCALAIAEAMEYLHRKAVPGCMVLHRDLKPDNVAFSISGKLKIIDFGLSTIVENASCDSNETYNLSGETGSLRYMAPEVADALPYNHKADVYSFGMILWELTSYEKPFANMDRKMFYERVVHGGERPDISKRVPAKWASLIKSCWSYDHEDRPTFTKVIEDLNELIDIETNKTPSKGRFSKYFGRTESATNRQENRRVMQDRQSAWF